MLNVPSSAIKREEPCKDSHDQQGGMTKDSLILLSLFISPIHLSFSTSCAISYIGLTAFLLGSYIREVPYAPEA